MVLYSSPVAAPKRNDGVKQSRREILGERIWAGLLVFYSTGAAFLVWKTLSKYGVNPIAFLIIDMVSSWPYGISTARIVVNAVKRRWHEVRKWAWVAAATFIAPDVYVLASARHAPRRVYLFLIVVISALIISAVLSVVLQVRSKGKRENSAPS